MLTHGDLKEAFRDNKSTKFCRNFVEVLSFRPLSDKVSTKLCRSFVKTSSKFCRVKAPYGPIRPLWAHKGPYGPIMAQFGLTKLIILMKNHKSMNKNIKIVKLEILKVKTWFGDKDL